MRFFYLMVIVSGVFLTLNKEEDNFRTTAGTDGTLLYNVYFTENEGYAVSNNHTLFTSRNNGNTWQEAGPAWDSNFDSKKFIWSARICCSSLKTTDGGNSWIPCSSESQDKFCRVFLKDPNTGYQPAEEFLNMVSKKIFTCLLNRETNSLRQPCKYTEYYSNRYEGWAPGWYLSELTTFDTLKELE